MSAPVELRRVLPEDWAASRALRLESLQDTPLAYLEAYADAVAQPDAVWQARAARGAVGGDSFQVMAWEGDRPVGNAIGLPERGDVVVAAVYVAPDHRGQGLLDRLLERVAAWAREQGAPQLRLLVHETNGRAQRAYERLGFSLTGHREPSPLDPTTDELEMALRLPAA